MNYCTKCGKKLIFKVGKILEYDKDFGFPIMKGIKICPDAKIFGGHSSYVGRFYKNIEYGGGRFVYNKTSWRIFENVSEEIIIYEKK